LKGGGQGLTVGFQSLNWHNQTKGQNETEPKYFSTTLGDKEVTFETGRLARQAGGAVTLRQGDSMILQLHHGRSA